MWASLKSCFLPTPGHGWEQRCSESMPGGAFCCLRAASKDQEVPSKVQTNRALVPYEAASAPLSVNPECPRSRRPPRRGFGFQLLGPEGGGGGPAVQAVPGKSHVLYCKLTEVIEVVQTQFILAGFAAAAALPWFVA